MANLIIEYDLYEKGQRYYDLIQAIKGMGAWAKIGLSCWYVSCRLSAVEAKALLSRYIDENDKLFIVNASNNTCAEKGLDNEVIKQINLFW